MKLTWFGGRTLRILIGGSILVLDPAPIDGVVPAELVSGADLVLGADEALPAVDTRGWRPRRAATVVEETNKQPGPAVHDAGAGSILIDAVGEPPLLLFGAHSPEAGRWARDAVVIAFDPTAAADALDRLEPRLIALALPENDLDGVFGALRDRLGDTALVALERGLALEI